jgi:hypothetical protein
MLQKPGMKYYLTFLIVLLFFLLSCKKEEAFMNKGVITGFDVRDCPCCGGLMINFKGEQQSYTGEFYLIENDPSELGIDGNATFPINVKVDWTQEGTGCTSGAIGNLIKITKFEKE